MKRRLLLAALAAAAVTFGLALRAQEPNQGSKKPDDRAKQIKEDLTLLEQIQTRRFAEFEQALLKLKQRLEKSPKQEDRDRAVILGRALDKVRENAIGVQFEQIVEFLKNRDLKSLPDVTEAAERSSKLAENLREELLALLREDTRAAKLRDERLRLEQVLKEIERIIREQEIARTLTDRNKTEKTELKKIQGDVTQATAKVSEKLGGKENQGGEAKNSKGDAKEGSKAGAKTGEAKDAGKPGGKKGGEAKDAGKDDKGSSLKEKKGDAKPGDPADKKDPKEGGAKSGAKGGDPKAGAKDAKGGDPKAGDAKSGGDPKQGEAKSGDKSSGQGQAKSGGQPNQQQPPQQAGSKGDNKQQPPPKAGNQDPQAQNNNGKKQVQDAEYKMKQAEEKIAGNKNPEASKDQGDAIDKLNQAKKKLEELLKQLREEELERLLAALQLRCEKMLAMQTAVLYGTEQVYKSIQNVPDKKAGREDQQKSLKLSDDEKEIVLEASKAIEMLEAEGSAVAFPEVFQQVREDMKHVQRRLGVVDTGIVTQGIEKDIIETLKEMIEALKKARQELDDKKAPPPKDGQQPPNADQKLLDQIAELKMIRSMQKRVNDRTQLYGKQYQEKEGEQTSNPIIRGELRNLSERQDRIFEVTNRIAKGDNK